MSNRQRLALLILIMITVSLIVGGFTIYQLYETAFEQQRERLSESVHSQARLIESIGRFDATHSRKDYPEGELGATLSQVVEAHKKKRGFGKTGEFTLGKLEKNQIVFLIRDRHIDIDKPMPIPNKSELAEPMRRALTGIPGSVIGYDYRGKMVLSVYDKVKNLNWGLVAKIDLEEIREPFVKAGLISVVVAFFVVFIGATLFYRLTNPLIEQLKESEQRFKDAFEQAAVGIAHVGTDGKFLRVNQKLCDIVGYTYEELIQLTFHDITHPDDLDVNLHNIKQMLDGKIQTYKTEKRYIRKDDSIVWASTTLSLTRDKTGKPKYFIPVIEDITTRKKAEDALRDSEALFRTFFESAAIAIAIGDMTGHIIKSNNAMTEMFGYSKEELMKLTTRELTHPDDLEIGLAKLNEVLEGKIEHYHLEKRYVRKDGQIIWGYLTVSLVFDSDKNPQFVIGMIENITKRKQAEELIDKQVQQLKQANIDLEEFSYVASHDLQEPLRTLSSYCTLLEQDIGDSLSPRAKEDINFIIDAARRMQRLVKDLLQLSRAGRSQLDIKAVNLNECMENIVNDLQSYIEETNSKVEWDNLPIVQGDETHLTRVLQNIVTNGIKFNNNNLPHIKVSAENGNSTCKIAITDNGIGMEKIYLDQIFLPFKRLHGMGKYEGTGIGLAICRKIIQRHGGEITVDSESGKGSTFTFTLKA